MPDMTQCARSAGVARKCTSQAKEQSPLFYGDDPSQINVPGVYLPALFPHLCLSQVTHQPRNSTPLCWAFSSPPCFEEQQWRRGDFLCQGLTGLNTFYSEMKWVNKQGMDRAMKWLRSRGPSWWVQMVLPVTRRLKVSAFKCSRR